MLKIKAFTFIEVIIAILLTLIIAGSIYAVVLLSGNTYNNHMREDVNINEFLSFYSMMNEDWYQAKDISEHQDGCQLIRSDHVTVYYEFNTNRIIRKSKGVIDTCEFSCLEYKFNNLRNSKRNFKTLKLLFGVNSDTIPVLLEFTAFGKGLFLKNKHIGKN